MLLDSIGIAEVVGAIGTRCFPHTRSINSEDLPSTLGYSGGTCYSCLVPASRKPVEIQDRMKIFLWFFAEYMVGERSPVLLSFNSKEWSSDSIVVASTLVVWIYVLLDSLFIIVLDDIVVVFCERRIRRRYSLLKRAFLTHFFFKNATTQVLAKRRRNER